MDHHLTCPVSYFPCCFTASNTPTVSNIFPSGLFLPKTGNTIKDWPQCVQSDVCKTSKTRLHMDSDKHIRVDSWSHSLKKHFFSSAAKMIYIHLDASENPAIGLRSLAFPSTVISITTLTRLNKTPRLAWCQQAGILSDLISMSLQQHPHVTMDNNSWSLWINNTQTSEPCAKLIFTTEMRSRD